jgi:uncharacterized protein YneF (UPF0154 family)
MTGALVEGMIWGVIFLTKEIRRILKNEPPPDLNIEETERQMQMIEEDIGTVKRSLQRIRDGS